MESELLTKSVKTRKRVDERITFEEFCDLIHEDQKAHLIEAVLITDY